MIPARPPVATTRVARREPPVVRTQPQERSMTTTDRADGFVLLATKLHPPRRRRTLVARPRLRDLADRSRHRALTLVSAPAGFGKTTLVADWFADDRTTAWLSLDERDDDPVRFWTYVVAALATAVPDLGPDAASLLQGPGRAARGGGGHADQRPGDRGARRRPGARRLPRHRARPRSTTSVAFLLDHLPPQIRLVIATRADPPLPLGLAARRRRAARGPSRRPPLHRRRGGRVPQRRDGPDPHRRPTSTCSRPAPRGGSPPSSWPRCRCRDATDPAAFIAEFAGDDRFIVDYLADEVLERQTAEVRDFLLDTSILEPAHRAALRRGDRPRTTPGRRSSSSTGRTCSSSPLDDRRTWYRYHHLFGDVLRARLLDERPRAGAPSCTAGPATGSRPTATRRRRSSTRWPATTPPARRS